jgi:hypothetical protein
MNLAEWFWFDFIFLLLKTLTIELIQTNKHSIGSNIFFIKVGSNDYTSTPETLKRYLICKLQFQKKKKNYTWNVCISFFFWRGNVYISYNYK